MKKLLLILSILTLLSSCANDKTFTKRIDSNCYENYTIEPYGWANLEEKNDSIQYKVSVGNVVWSCLLVETVVVPVILTGWYLYEPVKEIKK